MKVVYKMIYNKVCLQCDKNYETKYKTSKYCSQECSKENKSVFDINGLCKNCGTPFNPEAKRKRCYTCTARQKYGTTLICSNKNCGKEFYRPPHVLKHDGKKYCSLACKYEDTSQKGSGHRQKTKEGYIRIYYPSHPDASVTGYMQEHRLVAEQKLGRRILKSEEVHHINGIKDDNRPENLEVLTKSRHTAITSKNNAEIRRKEKEELEWYRKTFGPKPE